MAAEVIGNYRIVAKIGEGGMGAVYLAEHALIGRQAAIKVLLPEMSHRQELVTRFFNEARAATAVKHPGIVEIYDFGYHGDGSAYIVMEYLEGESLSARLRRVRLYSEARAAALGRQVASALGAAHAKGIVHRDLKPDNIFIVRDPEIADGERTKILDFGIAKLATSETPGSAVTRTGMVMGTPSYMSPEQCKGSGQVDRRADLYALGCILYEMVCGHPPFVAEGAGEVMAHHIFSAVVPPSRIRPVTPTLEAILLRALAKDPSQRFASAEEMSAALRQVAPSGAFPQAAAFELPLGPAQAPEPGAKQVTTLQSAAGSTMPVAMRVRRKGRAWTLAAAAAVALAAGGGAIALYGGDGGHAPRPVDQPVARAEPPPPAPPAAPIPVPTPVPTPVPPPPVGERPQQPLAATLAPIAEPTTVSAPVKLRIRIASEPTGAEVYRMPEGARIGTAPLDYQVDPSPGEIALVLKKRGYDDQRIAVRADRDSEATVELVRRQAVAPTKPTVKTPPPAGGTLDPFDKLKAK